MISDLLEDSRTDPVVRAMFQDLKRTGALLKPEDSAAAMVALLRKRNFQSGDHVDFYDDKVKEALGGSVTSVGTAATPASGSPAAGGSGASVTGVKSD